MRFWMMMRRCLSGGGMKRDCEGEIVCDGM